MKELTKQNEHFEKDESIKMTTLSTSSWHFKFIKYIYGNNSVDITKMRNLCPYFWILVSAMLVSVIAVPIKLFIVKPVLFIEKIILNKQRQKFDAWLLSLEDVEVYEFSDFSLYEDDNPLDIHLIKIPKYIISTKEFKLNYRYNYNTILKRWAKLKSINIDNNWLQQTKYKREHTDNKIINRYKQIVQKKNDSLNKRAIKLNKINIIVDRIINMFTFKIEFTSKFIKRTKKITGIILTTLFILFSYIIIEGISFIILYLTINFTIIAALYISLIILFILTIVLLVLTIKYIINKIEDIILKKQQNNKNTPILTFILNILNFFKLSGLFLWKLIIIGIFAGFGKSIWKVLKSSSGIFGEYFSASYGDFCPGVEWENNTNNK